MAKETHIRLPEGLHAAVAAAAKARGVSFNAMVVILLGDSLGWRGGQA